MVLQRVWLAFGGVFRSFWFQSPLEADGFATSPLKCCSILAAKFSFNPLSRLIFLQHGTLLTFHGKPDHRFQSPLEADGFATRTKRLLRKLLSARFQSPLEADLFATHPSAGPVPDGVNHGRCEHCLLSGLIMPSPGRQNGRFCVCDGAER